MAILPAHVVAPVAPTLNTREVILEPASAGSSLVAVDRTR